MQSWAYVRAASSEPSLLYGFPMISQADRDKIREYGRQMGDTSNISNAVAVVSYISGMNVW